MNKTVVAEFKITAFVKPKLLDLFYEYISFDIFISSFSPNS